MMIKKIVTLGVIPDGSICQVLLYILCACEQTEAMMVAKVRLILKGVPRESSIVSYVTSASKHTPEEM